MTQHKSRCVEANNLIEEWLRKYDIKFPIPKKPVYHNHYRMYILEQNPLNNEQGRTRITIKRNGAVMLTVDRRIEFQGITARQRLLSRKPRWLRIEFGCDGINQFFREMVDGDWLKEL